MTDVQDITPERIREAREAVFRVAADHMLWSAPTGREALKDYALNHYTALIRADERVKVLGRLGLGTATYDSFRKAKDELRTLIEGGNDARNTGADGQLPEGDDGG